MRRSTRLRLAAVSIAVLALAGGVLAGCGDDDSDAAATTAPKELTKVTFALDWTPNTNHTGVYAAEALGYYKDAGIDLDILPYSTTPVEPRISNGQADFGISYHDGVVFGQAAGLDVVSVLAVLQKSSLEIGVAADRDDINSPKDLDGKTYAGFGVPFEKPVLQQIIKNDGGTGEFKSITLATAAYDAVYRGKADFALPLRTWEGVQAEQIGKPFKSFQLADYGIPAQYAIVIASSQKYLDANPEVSKAFVEATQKGYEYAAEHPKEASDLLIEGAPELAKDTELVYASQELISSEYLKDADGKVGPQTQEQWEAYAKFLYDAKLLVDSKGKPTTAPPEYEALFTNDYLAN